MLGWELIIHHGRKMKKTIALFGLVTILANFTVACKVATQESTTTINEKRKESKEKQQSPPPASIQATSIPPASPPPNPSAPQPEIADFAMQRNIAPKIAKLESKRAITRKPTPQPISLKPEEKLEETSSEEYESLEENPFQLVQTKPLSTFSIDVDAASYSNVRRFLNNGQLPPADAVRIEELINYFTYDYPQPKDKYPFTITTEMSQSPWNPQHKLVNIGLQGKKIAKEDIPPSNLVFLLDVSGSMNNPNKLPLLKSAFRLLVNQLRPEDRVAIVVYAGSAGLVLPSTPGSDKDKILAAINNLEAGGSTAGGEGIKLAYKIARENYLAEGNNRIILATDGDFNVGIASDTQLVKLIEEKRKQGVFLTVLGFGTGNYKDAKMEKLADKGNGNYAYLDNILEAKKVLVKEMGATLFTIAKDVKIQVEFNPAKVQAYRLIGYENRLLQDRDFNDDTKDAGELGAGHSVTALYEIIPVGAKTEVKLPEIDPLRYQYNVGSAEAYENNELMQVKLRYKEPQDSKSKLITQPVVERNLQIEATSDNFRFSAAVAGFGMILKNSQYQGNVNLEQVLQLAKGSQGTDLEGYREEFIGLLNKTQSLQ